MSTACLILTPWLSPHQTMDWQEAITLVYLQKVDVLEHHDEFVSSPSTTLQLPAVARLKKPLARMKFEAKFSRVNVYARDGFRCQYCGLKRPMKALNYDHVIPRTQGGKTLWENIVTSCLPCNLRKGGRTPEQAGMRLRKWPSKPKALPLSTSFVPPREVPVQWRPYLSDDILDAVG